MSRILVTGASGFIGAALCAALAARGRQVREAHRRLPEGRGETDRIAVGQLGAATDWRRALEGVTQVVHLAGPAHGRFGADTLEQQIAAATAALASQAEAAGARRFVFVSSIKAGAEIGGPLSEAMPPAPRSPYGQAKLRAEAGLLAHPALSPVVLRAPLVHAPHAKGNFALLLRLAAGGAPLPLAGLRNKRSLIALEALVSAIMVVLEVPDGPSGVYYVADQPPCATPEIVAALRAGMGRPAHLFEAGAFARVFPAPLTRSLFADDTAFRTAYGYGAAAGMDSLEALRQCGKAWAARA